MKRTWEIVGTTIFWCLVVAFFVATAILRSQNERARKVERVSIVVKDAHERNFITPEIIHNIIDNEGLNPIGRNIDSLDLARINRAVEGYCFTAEAITYVDYEGTLTVEVTQREPVVRIRTESGHDLYLTRGPYVLPVQPHASLNLPIVTGNVELPFGRSFEGSLREWLADGEKNHKENYNFLCKLINFVVSSESDEWLKGRIVQINLVAPATKGKGDEFREPTVEIVPSDGDYIVELGELENVDAKVERWRTFVEARVVDLKGGRLDVRYDNQALWKAPKANKAVKKSKK